MSHEDIIYSIGNVVSDAVAALYDDKWLLDLTW